MVTLADIKAAVDVVSEKTNDTLDYLINNAGRNHFMAVLNEALDNGRGPFEVNFLGPMALRLELAPFGVDVLEVVTGGVKTMGQTYFDDFKLPSKSLYKSIEGHNCQLSLGPRRNVPNGHDEILHRFAYQIVTRTTGTFWCGENVDMVKMSTKATAVSQLVMVS